MIAVANPKPGLQISSLESAEGGVRRKDIPAYGPGVPEYQETIQTRPRPGGGLTANFRFIDCVVNSDDDGNVAVTRDTEDLYVFRVLGGSIQSDLLDLSEFPTGIDPEVDTYDVIRRVRGFSSGSTGAGFTAKTP